MTMPGGLVGLDFGMTNSLLSYYDPEQGVVAFAGVTGDAFAVPTVIFGKHEGSRIRWFFGAAATFLSGAVQHMKSRLAAVARLSDRERRDDKDYRATLAFIQNLIGDYQKANGVSSLDRIVVTVPEAWMSGGEQGGVETLRQVMKDLELPAPLFISEPVAAACYFAYRHKKLAKEDFDGWALIFDHGGSTLDIALVRVAGDQIRQVSSYGSGLEQSDTGFGGVHFDNLVFQHIAQRKASLLKLSPEKRAEWLANFEALKRRSGPLIEAACEDGEITSLGSIAETEILSSDLLEVFDTHFARDVEAALQGVLSRAAERESELEISNPKKFRVVSVGGFSEFYPIQLLIKKFFASKFIEPGVLVSHLGRNDRWQAVSKGACLVAADVVHVDFRCPFTFGIVSYDSMEPRYNELLKYGRPQTDYAYPSYLPARFGPGGLKERHNLQFYIESSGMRRMLNVDSRLRDVLPDYDVAGNTWQAAGVIREGVVEVSFRSVLGGGTRSVRLGKLMSMVNT